MAIYSGFSHWKWWFSIVMLVYQRVTNSRFRMESSGNGPTKNCDSRWGCHRQRIWIKPLSAFIRNCMLSVQTVFLLKNQQNIFVSARSYWCEGICFVFHSQFSPETTSRCGSTMKVHRCHDKLPTSAGFLVLMVYTLGCVNTLHRFKDTSRFTMSLGI